MSGPLDGIRIVELAGLGPAPFAGMMLADAGADIIRIDRWERATYPPHTEAHVDLMNRGRRSVAVDLKHPEGVALVLRLVEQADGLMEGFRPGVAERLGFGPEVCLARNPKLVFGRMTGWGQDGPMAQRPATTSTTSPWPAPSSRWAGPASAAPAPQPGRRLRRRRHAAGLRHAGRHHQRAADRRRPGGRRGHGRRGRIADDHDTTPCAPRACGAGPRGTNLLDTGAHFYEVYETSDGGFIGVGAIEPQFYAELIRLMGLDGEDLPAQKDRRQWPAMKERFAQVFATKTRAEWEEIFEGSDACAAPVLSPAEAPDHPHNRFRRTFTEVAGVVQPSPSPRFVRTPGSIRRPPPNPGPARGRGPGRLGTRRGGHRRPTEVGRHPLSRLRRGSAPATAPASEIDHRTGDRPGDPLDELDPPHHHPAQLVDGVRLGPHDDVVGAGHPLGGHHTVQGRHGAGHHAALPPRSGSARRR